MKTLITLYILSLYLYGIAQDNNEEYINDWIETIIKYPNDIIDNSITSPVNFNKTTPLVSSDDNQIITKKLIEYSSTKIKKLKENKAIKLKTPYNPEYIQVENKHCLKAHLICPYQQCGENISTHIHVTTNKTEHDLHYYILRKYFAHIIKHEAYQLPKKHSIHKILNLPSTRKIKCPFKPCTLRTHKSIILSHLFTHIWLVIS